MEKDRNHLLYKHLHDSQECLHASVNLKTDFVNNVDGLYTDINEVWLNYLIKTTKKSAAASSIYRNANTKLHLLIMTAKTL